MIAIASITVPIAAIDMPAACAPVRPVEWRAVEEGLLASEAAEAGEICVRDDSIDKVVSVVAADVELVVCRVVCLEVFVKLWKDAVGVCSREVVDAGNVSVLCVGRTA